MKIYRVEHPNTGQGPYTSGFDISSWWVLGNKLCNEHSDSEHPSIEEDKCDPHSLQISINQQYKWVCGFRTLKALNTWFSTPNDWRDKLGDFGFKISVYEVEQRFTFTGISGLQLIFNKKKAKLLCTRYF
jgi:hypothetical protein